MAPRQTLLLLACFVIAARRASHSQAVPPPLGHRDATLNQDLPVYVPHHLRPIPWPPHSPDPGFHMSDVTGVIVPIGRLRIGIQRIAVIPWGTDIMNEAYFVFLVEARASADSVAVRGGGVGDSVWSGRSYYIGLNGPTESAGFSWVGGCLFVADDSLLAYSIVTDTTAGARAFVNELRLRRQSGYYHFDPHLRTFVKIADRAPAFDRVCRAQLIAEQRGPVNP